MSATNIEKSLLLPILRGLQKQRLKDTEGSSSVRPTDNEIDNVFDQAVLSIEYIQLVDKAGKIDNKYNIRLTGTDNPAALKTAITNLKPYIASEILDLKHSNSLRNKTKGHIVETLAKGIDAKAKKAKRKSRGRVSKKVSPGKTTASTEPLKILASINARLPSAIADNMGDPALNFRTGRFANSVKALSVKTTNTGLSISYRYQTDPYQVFEMGLGRAPWATTQRDPRKLIGRTIREIAAELVTSKIFVRRVF